MTTTQLPDTASPSPLEVDLAVLPKVSLHDHLDGGLRVGTVLDLAREAGVEVPADTVEGLAEWIAEHANGESLEKYLQVFALTTAVMQTREQLRRVAREFVEDLVADGVIYGEIRWAPEQHLAGGLSLDEAVEAVQAGLDEAVEAADAAGHVIRVGQLVTAMRHADRAQEIAELAVRHREAGVVGFDIAGAEAGFPPSRFADTFTWLAAHHLPVTVHAGEGDGLDSVRSALVDGRALRLGHGVRLAEDISVEYGGVDEDGEQLDELTGIVDLGETAAWVRDRQIALEVCPSSNLQTGAVDAAAGIAGHPIDLLVQLGFRVTVNTDNRLVSDVSLTDELYLLAETFGYSLSELLDLQLNAAEAAFLSVDEREDLAEILVAGWGEVISGDAVGPVLEELDDEDEDD
ncbi:MULTISPECIES: adenosine deaminase [Micrococcus]|uniref:adenosine deaminase n=1 Tax=Micrococcus TaxID=1269 RepID=UPI000597988C|nr:MULTISPECIES: adenosine deaminase [Micrococcus]KIK89048.1 adenosine deaminase [Micrococcus luteus]MCT1871726.1 adenosine deaminase [Micrococcus luteus]MCV7549385.1 adenosine deaminase [Micrococcus luteus]RNM04971.1 adenosine deaminase [Micrococcus sp. RIT608]